MPKDLLDGLDDIRDGYKIAVRLAASGSTAAAEISTEMASPLRSTNRKIRKAG